MNIENLKFKYDEKVNNISTNYLDKQINNVTHIISKDDYEKLIKNYFKMNNYTFNEFVESENFDYKKYVDWLVNGRY